jgi:hypothetical protein
MKNQGKKRRKSDCNLFSWNRGYLSSFGFSPWISSSFCICKNKNIKETAKFHRGEWKQQ